MDPTQISVAIIMVGVTAICFAWLQSSMAAASAGRMMDMFKRVGLDLGTAKLGEPQTMAIGKKMQRRCRRCSREALCERWLSGKIEGGNAFCPNAEAFRILAEAGAPALTASRT
jgi:hypothetical protein